ncbi:MAG: hypothetical protein NVSMB9_19650 [Isosphaeraceae bacterium]
MTGWPFMPLETLVWIRDLKAIEHEYRITLIAVRRLADQARHDPTILDKNMRVHGIGEALSNLNATYAIRLFAEFETGLRKFWVATRTAREPRGIAEIMDRIAARYGIGHDDLTNAHRSRMYRNRQIHDNEQEGETIEVRDCRSFLCIFLSKMPSTWEPPTL